MGTTPKASTLSREDFPEQAQWIDKLLRPLNAFMASTESAFPAGLTANGAQMGVVCFPASVTFTTSGTVTDSFPFYFSTPAKARSVEVAQIENLSTGDTFTGAVFPTWEASSESGGYRVKVRHLTGLTTSTQYRVTFKVTL